MSGGPSPAPKIPSYALKGDRESIEHRRSMVKEMLLRGMTVSSIAKVLGVHRNTVINDVHEVRRQMRLGIKNLDPVQEVADTVEFFQMVAKEAIIQFHGTNKHGAKNSYLNTALKAIETKMKLLAITGMIPNRGLMDVVDAEVTSERNKTVERKFEKAGIKEILKSPESRRKLLSVMNKLMWLGKKDILETAGVAEEVMRKEGAHGGQTASGFGEGVRGAEGAAGGDSSVVGEGGGKPEAIGGNQEGTGGRPQGSGGSGGGGASGDRGNM